MEKKFLRAVEGSQHVLQKSELHVSQSLIFEERRTADFWRNCGVILQEIRELESLLRGEKSTSISEQKEAAEERLRKLKFTYKDAINQIIRIERILKAGYRPGVPPDDWHVGYIQRRGFWKFVGDDFQEKYLTYRQPLPYDAENKYRSAKASRFFDDIVIASPFHEDFVEFGTGQPVFTIYGFTSKDASKSLAVVTNRDMFFQYYFLEDRLKDALGFVIVSGGFPDDQDEIIDILHQLIDLRVEMASRVAQEEINSQLDEIIEKLAGAEVFAGLLSIVLTQHRRSGIAFDIKKISSEDLPRLLRTYIDLSPVQRKEESGVLLKSLRIIRSRIDEIAEAVESSKTFEFEVAAEFIKEKFGDETIGV